MRDQHNGSDKILPISEKEKIGLLPFSQDSLFLPIERKRTFEQVFEKIKKLIFSGVLRPGDRLPSEAELARKFGVGRQTVRESMRLLESSGFVSVRKGSLGGPVVVHSFLDALSNLFLDSFQMQKITVDELTTTRLEMEMMVLGLVIMNATSQDFEPLRENIFKAYKKVEVNETAFYENIQFHRLLARASKNQMLAILMELIMLIYENFLCPLEASSSKKVVSCHERILDAVIAKDRHKAVALLEEDLSYTKECFRFEHNFLVKSERR